LSRMRGNSHVRFLGGATDRKVRCPTRLAQLGVPTKLSWNSDDGKGLVPFRAVHREFLVGTPFLIFYKTELPSLKVVRLGVPGI
jgi:hypothetical protein